VVSGAPDGPAAGASLAGAAQEVAARVRQGERTKAAAAAVARELGLRSADVYNAVHQRPSA
jgi:hypothetical protein